MIEKDAPIEANPLSPLQTFCVKVAVVTSAVLVVLFFVSASLQSFVEDQMGSMRGGPAFWQAVEKRLYNLADERDLSPEKKQKVMTALAKISERYKPYFDVLAGQPPKQ